MISLHSAVTSAFLYGICFTDNWLSVWSDLQILNNITYMYTSLFGIVIKLIFKNIYPWDINFFQRLRVWDINFFFES